MKTIMRSLIAVMCLIGFSSLSFAEQLGMKNVAEMKGELKVAKDTTKAKKDAMKAKKDKKRAKKDRKKDKKMEEMSD